MIQDEKDVVLNNWQRGTLQVIVATVSLSLQCMSMFINKYNTCRSLSAWASTRRMSDSSFMSVSRKPSRVMCRKQGEQVVMEIQPIASFVSVITRIPLVHTGPDPVSLLDFTWKDLNRHFRMIENPKEDSPPLTAEDEQRLKNEARAVAQYAANREDCRRVLILAKFRETYFQTRCRDGCDNCLENHDASPQDMSSEAVKILRLLEGAHQSKINLTENELVATFKGRSVKSFKSKGLENLPFSGAGSSVDMAIIERIVCYLGREDGLTQFERASGPGGWNQTYLKVSITQLVLDNSFLT